MSIMLYKSIFKNNFIYKCIIDMQYIKDMIDKVESYEDKTDILMQALEKLINVTSDIISKSVAENNELSIRLETVSNENSLLKQLVEALKQK